MCLLPQKHLGFPEQPKHLINSWETSWIFLPHHPSIIYLPPLILYPSCGGREQGHPHLPLQLFQEDPSVPRPAECHSCSRVSWVFLVAPSPRGNHKSLQWEASRCPSPFILLLWMWRSSGSTHSSLFSQTHFRMLFLRSWTTSQVHSHRCRQELSSH